MEKKTVSQYIKERSTYRETYALDEHGIWEIYGEDANCDFGGPHVEPFLMCVEGTYEKAVDYALRLPRFFTWGWGGTVKRAATKEIVKL